ncbi:hypothetical protein [Flagellimonas lutimaris]|uniref:hypothetical protein n=1 Tax=Flagellimonas lutimaris TaxID=475082 RepID=UPI003F5CD287
MGDFHTSQLADTSRRDFFKQLVLGGSGLYLSPLLFQSCDTEDLGRPPFGVWEDMIKMLEQSPDHLVGRRKALVASKDPKAMTEFVRDSFQILPSNRDFLKYMATETLYGTQMALRCGLATPREKAEILKNMLVEAGFEAKVVWETTTISLDQAKDITFRQYIPEFDPPISNRRMRKWHKALGIEETNANVELILNFMERSETLANNLLASIDEKYIKEKPVKQGFDEKRVPTVVYYDNGEEKYAHVFDPEVPFGQLHPTNTAKEFKDAKALKEPKEQDISITLSCRNVMDKWNESTLVTGTWKLSELLGNQLQIQFLNNMAFGDQATKTVSQISNFTPCLALQDINKDVAYLEERSYLGEPITLEGEKVLERYTPTVQSDEDLAAAVGKIHLLEGKVDPKTYPKVRLELEPKDADGNIIGGLSMGNFELVDNGQSVTGWMKQNSISPRILLMYDTSGSMPKAYRGDGIKAFLAETRSMISEVYPSAQVFLQETDSTLYTSLLNGKQYDADLIIYATDGENSDEYDASYQSIYNSGPPAILLNVYDKDTHYKRLRENIDFTEIAADDQQTTITEIKKYVDQLSFLTYVVTYNSFDEDKDHKLTLKIKDTEHQIELPFKFPMNNNVLGNRIIGLYLTLKGKGMKTITRVLAGYEPQLDRNGNKIIPNRQMIQEVHEMLLGGAVMAFEREAPTLSVQLTEYLQTLMSNRGWYEAYQDNNMDRAIEELGKGTLSYPQILLSMMQRLQNQVTENAVTYPKGFRACIIKAIPGYYNKKTSMSFDYLPTSEYLSIMRNGEQGFRETIKKTAQLAILEGHMFDDSAYSQLHEKPLILNMASGSNKEFVKNALADNFPYYYPLVNGRSTLKFIDTSLQTKSYWNINPWSGELYGILPDQTGGGFSTTKEQLEELQVVIREYSKLVAQMNLGMTITGVGTMPIGIVATYSLTLVKLYAFASQALILMDAGGIDEKINEALGELACNVYKEILYSSMGRIGTAISTLENVDAASPGNSTIKKLIACFSVSCP